MAAIRSESISGCLRQHHNIFNRRIGTSSYLVFYVDSNIYLGLQLSRFSNIIRWSNVRSREACSVPIQEEYSLRRLFGKQMVSYVISYNSYLGHVVRSTSRSVFKESIFLLPMKYSGYRDVIYFDPNCCL